MAYRENDCNSCHSGQMPWWSCLLLGAGVAAYDTMGDNLLKSRELGNKVAGVVVKEFGKLLDGVFKFYCQ